MTRRVKTQLIAVFLFAGFFSACGGENFAQIRNIRSPGETIICFGDSLTEGVGAGEGEDYPSVLSRQLASPVVNAGRRGDTTADALQRLSDTVLIKNPRLVILLLGGNDFLRQATASGNPEEPRGNCPARPSPGGDRRYRWHETWLVYR
jgi:lysophospholipase L1-like esterase